MKTLYLIGGTMGVGKTTVCHILKKQLPHSVFLDGDWCWDAHPFTVTEETKAMVMDNICHLLNNFLRCSEYQNVVFCWVLHEQSIIHSILEKLETERCKVICVSLTANEKTIRERILTDVEKGIRTVDVLERSLARLPFYAKLSSIQIPTDGKSPEAVAEEIRALRNEMQTTNIE